MSLAKHKIYLTLSLFALTLMLGLIGPLQKAEAASVASQIYSLSCLGGKVTGATENKFSCNVGANTVGVDSVDDKTPAPETVEQTVIKVDCGKHAIYAPPKAGATVTAFKCNAGDPKITVLKVIPADANGSQPASANSQTCQSGGACVECDNTVAGGGGCDCTTSCTDNAANKECSNGQGCDIVAKYINPAVKLFTTVFGIGAVISIILGAISYSASGGDPQKVAHAKNRIFKTVIAIVAYSFFYGLLQFIIPGGV